MIALSLVYILIAVFAYLLVRLIVQTVSLLSWKSDAVSTPPISIVVASRNMKSNLEKLIPSLMQQDYPDFEVIIALDRCSDDSLDLMKSFEKKHKTLKTVIIDHLPDHFSPKKYALTLGIKAAKNDWVLLTDADCLPKSGKWIQSFGKQMSKENDFVLGYSPYLPENNMLNRFIRYETFRTAFHYLSSALIGLPYMGVGRNLAFRKSLFLSSLGYNQFQHIMGGDDDLFIQYHAQSKRTAINLGGDSLTFSEGKQDSTSYWIQKKRHFSVSKFYKPRFKYLHTWHYACILVFWICTLVIPMVDATYWWILSFFLFYYLAKGICHYFAGKRMGEGYPYGWLALFEAFYITFVPVAVLLSTTSKKVKWN